jgi:acetate kinase
VRVLVLNAGSSSLKASAIEDGETLARTSVSWGPDATQAPDREGGLKAALATFEQAGVPSESFDAVGHRVVHGGSAFTRPTVLDDVTLAALDAIGDLAPLHNAVAIETIRAARTSLPGLPNVGCFDTAFHADLPPTATQYAVPGSWYAEWGIRRYGFHGLSVAWAVDRGAGLLGKVPEDLGLIVAHLGSGCSVTAVDGGRSVWTSMGFTPLEGLMMGTRSGSIDPGILVHLLRSGRLDLDELADTLEHRSGLLGVSGRSADVRELVAAADAGDDRARLALEMFFGRSAAGIAAAASSLRRLDAVVFTGGIGEHAGGVRAAIVDRLAVLGVRPISTLESGEDRVIEHEGLGTTEASRRPSVLRVEAREDLVIAGEVVRLARGGAIAANLEP